LLGLGLCLVVLSGHVEIGTPAGHGTLVLHAGQGNVTGAGNIGKPVNLLPAPQLAQAPVRDDRASAQFALTPVDGATAYHIQIATDQDAQNMLMESRSTGTRVKLDGLPNGDYFARISAIDRQNLEGPASIHAFTLPAAVTKEPLAAPAAPFVDRSDNQHLTLKWKGQPGQKFTIQVSRDAGFGWLINSATTAATQISLPRPPFGTYYARVQAINSDGSTTPYSLAQPFIVTDQWIIHDGNPVGARDAAISAGR
jgi:predicted phage tail protein